MSTNRIAQHTESLGIYVDDARLDGPDGQEYQISADEIVRFDETHMHDPHLVHLVRGISSDDAEYLVNELPSTISVADAENTRQCWGYEHDKEALSDIVQEHVAALLGERGYRV